MPAGISHPGLGYATFCAIKFAGYTAAAHFLSMQLRPRRLRMEDRRSPHVDRDGGGGAPISGCGT